MDTRLVSVLAFITVACCKSTTDNPPCKRGQYLYIGEGNNMSICSPCENGKFMPEESHYNTTCIPCRTVNITTETSISECNRTHDAVIECMYGYRSNSTECRKDPNITTATPSLWSNGTTRNATGSGSTASSGLSTGGIIGIVCGSVVVILVIMAIIICIWKRRGRRQPEGSTTSGTGKNGDSKEEYPMIEEKKGSGTS